MSACVRAFRPGVCVVARSSWCFFRFETQCCVSFLLVSLAFSLSLSPPLALFLLVSHVVVVVLLLRRVPCLFAGGAEYVVDDTAVLLRFCSRGV